MKGPSDRPIERAIERIAARLHDGAICSGGEASWSIAPKSSGAPRPVADGSLYSGTAGIGWFLADHYRLTGDRKSAQLALDAIRRSRSWLASSPHARGVGFHVGATGIIYTLAHVGLLLEREDLLEAARAGIDGLGRRVREDKAIDVIGGSAGALPPLVHLAEAGIVDGEPAMLVVEEMCEHLYQTGQWEIEGRSWPTMPNTAARNLCGLAHGASGCGLALLVGSAVIDDLRYRLAGERAFEYERAFLNRERGEWMDLRHSGLIRLAAEHPPHELSRLAEARGIGGYETHYSTAWCHGAPGIGLARLRGLQATGREWMREELGIALETCRGVITRARHDWSLCHGFAGNAFAALAGARAGEGTCAEDEIRGVVEEALAERDFADTALPSGAVQGAEDPSMMVGEAGMGLFLMNVLDDSIVTPLIMPPSATTPPLFSGAACERVLIEEIEAYFPTSKAAGWHFNTSAGELMGLALSKSGEIAVPAVAEVLTHVLTSERSALAEEVALATPLKVDEARHEAMKGTTDNTQVLRRRDVSPAEIEPGLAVGLGPNARIVVDAGTSEEGVSGESHDYQEAKSGKVFLCYHDGFDVRIAQVGGLAAAIVELTADEPTPVETLVVSVAEAAGVAPPQVRDLVIDQVREGLSAGVLTIKDERTSGDL